MKNRALFLKELALAGLCLAGTGGVLAVNAAEFREELHQTHPLDAHGKVSIENVNGSIQVRAWERSEVKIDALKKARKEEHLAEVKILVSAEAGSVRIRTQYPEKGRGSKNNSVSVEYTLMVPREVDLSKVSTVNGSVQIERVEGKVQASTVNGGLSAEGLANEANLSSVNGAIEARFSKLQAGKDVRLHSVNGAVSIYLPPTPSATLSARTVNGGINTDFDLKAGKQFPLGHKLEATLGEGATRIRIETVNGAVGIRQTRKEARAPQ